MLVDEIKIKASSGRGGDGVERWLHEKGREFSGPAGGDGGRGGSVYFLAVRDVHRLNQYRNKKDFDAENGENGGSKSLHGRAGKDLFIEVPIGSVIEDLSTGEKNQLLSEGEELKVLKGGNGGLGNEHFKSSTNTKPKEWTAGKIGQSSEFFIELEIVADAGLIGFPNAGKSSLLNTLSNASAKVGAYKFTTLEPHLGEFFKFILADIPGLIEGAAEGKGLGHKFLRHIKRTKILLHLISLESETVMKDYFIIRKELESYDPELAKKEEIIILTKSDTEDNNKVQDIKKEIEKETNKKVFAISILDDKLIKKFSDELVKILRQTD